MEKEENKNQKKKKKKEKEEGERRRRRKKKNKVWTWDKVWASTTTNVNQMLGDNTIDCHSDKTITRLRPDTDKWRCAVIILVQSTSGMRSDVLWV